jgi:hypothetical protein
MRIPASSSASSVGGSPLRAPPVGASASASYDAKRARLAELNLLLKSPKVKANKLTMKELKEEKVRREEGEVRCVSGCMCVREREKVHSKV